MVPRISTDTQMCTPSLTYSNVISSYITTKGHPSVCHPFILGEHRAGALSEASNLHLLYIYHECEFNASYHSCEWN